MPNWTTPALPANNIIRSTYWQQMMDDLVALNDIIGHPNGGHVSFHDGAILPGNGTGALVDIGVLSKGSILTSDGGVDPIGLAVGSNDQALRAEGTAASGAKWEAPNWDVAEALMYG